MQGTPSRFGTPFDPAHTSLQSSVAVSNVRALPAASRVGRRGENVNQRTM